MSDLRSLSQFLTNWGKNVKNPNRLNTLSVSQISKDVIGYSLDISDPLVFSDIDIERHVRPVGIEKLDNKERLVDLKLVIRCQEAAVDVDFTDPIRELSVCIMLDIAYQIEGEFKEASCSWHLDRDDPEEALYSHPIYHMNFGGQHMTKKGDIFGNLLLLPSPRILHPPMDIVLACDFIIRNFYTKERHLTLTELPGYKILLKNAKDRYLKNFSYALTSEWNPKLKVSNLTAKKVFGH